MLIPCESVPQTWILQLKLNILYLYIIYVHANIPNFMPHWILIFGAKALNYAFTSLYVLQEPNN